MRCEIDECPAGFAAQAHRHGAIEHANLVTRAASPSRNGDADHRVVIVDEVMDERPDERQQSLHRAQVRGSACRDECLVGFAIEFPAQQQRRRLRKIAAALAWRQNRRGQGCEFFAPEIEIATGAGRGAIGCILPHEIEIGRAARIAGGAAFKLFVGL